MVIEISMPGSMARSLAIRSGRSARTVGSPPVIFSDRTPSPMKTRTSASISSNRRIWSLGSQSRPSAGMQ